MSETRYGTDDGFRRAMANANRLRLRTLGAATCATALAVALTGSLVPAQQSSGPSRLDVVTTPVTPSPPPAERPTAYATMPPATGAGVRAVAGSSARPAATAPSPTTVDDERPVPSGQARHPGPHSTGMSRSVTGTLPNVGCALTYSGWCFKTSNVIGERPAHVRWFDVDLCGSPPSSAQLRFETSAEVEMSVRDARGRVLWSWLSEHPPVRAPHEVTYHAGTPCLRWTVKWFERTNDGVALAPGRYRLVARFLGTAPAGLPESAVEFTL